MPKRNTAAPVLSQPAQLLARLKEISAGMVDAQDFESLQRAQAACTQQVQQVMQLLADRSLSLPGVEDSKESYSWSRVLLACHPDNWNRRADIAPFEWDVSEQTRKANSAWLEEQSRQAGSRMEAEQSRATNTTLTDSGGGFLVPSQKLSRFYEIFYASLVLDAAGATKLTGLVGEPVEIPKQDAGVQTYMVNEDSITGLSASEPTFKMLNLRPHEAVGTGSYTQRLLRMGNPSIDGIIERDFARKLALKVEDQIFNGTGANGEVKGILSGAGGTGNNPHLEGALSEVTDHNLANGSHTITQLNVIDFEGVLEDNDALSGGGATVQAEAGGGVSIISHPKLLRTFRKDTANQYVLPSPLSRDKIREITGYDWHTTTQIKTNLSKSGYTDDGSLTHFLMGAFADVLIGLWGGVEVRRSDVAYSPITSVSAFHQRLVHVLASQLFDGGVIRSQSVVASNEVRYT